MRSVSVLDHSSSKGHSQLPLWVELGDLLENLELAQVVFVAGGSENFSTTMDIVHTTPNYSKKRFVMYIKKGYPQIVEIGKNQWN